jgi:hypothetical protein
MDISGSRLSHGGLQPPARPGVPGAGDNQGPGKNAEAAFGAFRKSQRMANDADARLAAFDPSFANLEASEAIEPRNGYESTRAHGRGPFAASCTNLSDQVFHMLGGGGKDALN